ncbi:MAG: hypothetical protein H6923_04365 [Alphaproteobacteria bacterium]|nr:hypothetical protein [Alphaproteobacteria bacterium]
MTFHPKRWTRLSVALAAGTMLTTADLARAGEAAGSEAPTRLAWWIFGNEGESGDKGSSHHDEGGEGGEGAPAAATGEGGEGEGGAIASADPATDDVAYLTALSLIRGHLLVGLTLYRDGETLAAEAHMRHPAGELYGGIKDALKARKAGSFLKELDLLAGLAQGAAPLDRIEPAHAAVLAKVDTAAAKAAMTPKTAFTVATKLLKTAASEYDVSLGEDGAIDNAEEYQDAYGFTQEARRILASLSGDEAQEAVGVIDALAPLWPSIVPPAKLSTDASLLYGAAAKIEILGLGVD